MNPICVNDFEEMKVVKNGVTVNDGPMAKRAGDKYRCPVCGFEIITGFGDKYVSDSKPDLQVNY